MPLAFAMIGLLWIYLVSLYKVPFTSLSGALDLGALREGIGKMSQAEVRVGVVFLLTVLAWTLRKPVVHALGLEAGVVEDDTISMAMAISLFLIPARFADGQRRRLMDWETLLKTPWHLLFLFGGGFALAGGFKETGLSAWLGHQLAGLGGLPPVLVTLIVVLLVTFLTEVTSNTATANVLLPIIGEMAVASGIPPATLMVPATLAASCAFMLPVATPPNAVVFATGMVSMTDMAKTGFIVNVLSAFIITGWMFTWGKLWFPMDAAGAEQPVGHSIS